MLCNIEFFLHESSIIFNSCPVYNIILWTLAILYLVGRILYYIGCLTFSFYVPNLCTAIGNIFFSFYYPHSPPTDLAVFYLLFLLYCYYFNVPTWAYIILYELKRVKVLHGFCFTFVSVIVSCRYYNIVCRVENFNNLQNNSIFNNLFYKTVFFKLCSPKQIMLFGVSWPQKA